MKCPTCNSTMLPGSASIHRSNLGLLADAVLFDRTAAQSQHLYFQPAGADEATCVDQPGNVHGCPKCGTLVIASQSQPRQGADEAIECLSCGKTIPTGAAKCTACGWSWDDAAKA